MSNVMDGLFPSVSPQRLRGRVIERIRGVLADAELEGIPEERDPLERLVLDVIDALVDTEGAHDWSQVARVEVEAEEGEWRASVRLTRDASVGDPECAHARQRRWR